MKASMFIGFVDIGEATIIWTLSIYTFSAQPSPHLDESASAVASSSNSNFEKFDLEVEISVGRDHIASTPCPIAVIAGDLEFGLLAQAHFHDTLIPSANDLSETNRELEGLPAVSAAVELGSVLESPDIMHCQHISLLRECLAVP
eukprot:CAMPEP_0170174548 /NCGR_PEP_ID=MMETSP0040_2-20121228/7778_1 /TAXON_ID=641309 /ORGANISM="Lotharella oceanica, Strain CCMP622" /LENGTH=144 /DNA_ID=CAMNT_0010416241 /DNA_START=106 /DNA_END=540 /DNA_ORIENTATION=-